MLCRGRGLWRGLNSYPNTFAELSLLDANPYPNFTFADANALSNLPYGTALRVANGRREQVLIKRDIGYGQGPGQTIPTASTSPRPSRRDWG